MIKLRFSYVPGDGVILSVLMMAAHPDPVNPWDGSRMFGRKIDGICFVDKNGNVLGNATMHFESDLASLCRNWKEDHLEIDLPDVRTIQQTPLNFEKKKANVGKAGICLVDNYGWPSHWTYLAIREDIARFEIRGHYLSGAVEPANRNLLRNTALCTEMAKCYSGLFDYSFPMQIGSLTRDLSPLQKEFTALFEQGLKEISTLEEYRVLCKKGEDIIHQMEEVRSKWVEKTEFYKKAGEALS